MENKTIPKSYKLPQDFVERLAARREQAKRENPINRSISEADVLVYLAELGLKVEESWKTTKATNEIQNILENIDNEKVVDAIFDVQDEHRLKQLLAAVSDSLASRPGKGYLIRKHTN